MCIFDFAGRREFKTTYKKAQEGESEAQFNLGLDYFIGNYVNKNIDEALRWIHLSADNGYAKAQIALADVYSANIWVSVDLNRAMSYLMMAATQKTPEAELKLGIWYYEGVFCDKNIIQAFKWFHRALSHGCIEAFSAIGYILIKDEDLTQKAAAVTFFTRGAEIGDAESQRALGILYELGEGVTQDLKQAELWYRLAANQGHESAKTALYWLKKNKG